LRTDTSTIRTRSSCAAVAKAAYSKAPAGSFFTKAVLTSWRDAKGVPRGSPLFGS
jgi:hypothetical protein